MAAIEFRGPNAVTNFDISNYADKLKKFLPEVQVEEEVHVKEETNSTPPEEVQADEVLFQADEVQADEDAAAHEDPPETSSLKPEPKDSDESPKDSNESQGIVVMDPIEDHEHPWDLCLDTLFNILPIPEMPLGKGSEVFDYKGFDDDIECIFDDLNADAFMGPDLNASTSSSSSPLSSTTSALSNI